MKTVFSASRIAVATARSSGMFQVVGPYAASWNAHTSRHQHLVHNRKEERKSRTKR